MKLREKFLGKVMPKEGYGSKIDVGRDVDFFLY